MIEFIKQNKFEELKEAIKNTENSFKIHDYLGDVLNQIKVEIDGESFNAQRYQEEFFEGLKIYKALLESEIPKQDLNAFSNILVHLAFNTGGFTKLMADTAMKNGVYLSDIGETYKVDPKLRENFQEFIDVLKTQNNPKSVANVASAKAQITTSIGNLLKKEDIGYDMLQFAEAYANVGQTDNAIQIYRGILNDFESESVANSSGLFPEINYVDERSESEIDIFEKAKFQYEKLSGEKLPEINRIQINETELANQIAEEVLIKNKEHGVKQPNKEGGFFDKLKRLFKK